jgi:hypothetical protein
MMGVTAVKKQKAKRKQQTTVAIFASLPRHEVSMRA